MGYLVFCLNMFVIRASLMLVAHFEQSAAMRNWCMEAPTSKCTSLALNSCNNSSFDCFNISEYNMGMQKHRCHYRYYRCFLKQRCIDAFFRTSMLSLRDTHAKQVFDTG
ncbi:uncharacterized protein LOC119562556 [Drosophila subpulchrella]|uniref:uncharacterized protein LOC119562556 n=1 Tax=Drosophila subpulchrella TaxID=1486046 RepID=UPI0018A19807|nr:uncharacterized protein LOC119562556 [Drosophila subpulchrella]